MSESRTINEKIVTAMRDATAPLDDPCSDEAMGAQADAARTVLANVLDEYAAALASACAKVHQRRPATSSESAEPCPACRANAKAIRQAARIVAPDPLD